MGGCAGGRVCVCALFLNFDFELCFLNFEFLNLLPHHRDSKADEGE